MAMTKAEFFRHVDHSLLKPNLLKQDIVDGLNYARENHAVAVCVLPTYVELAAKMLQGSDVAVGTVVGFPNGTHTTFTKVAETKDLFAMGALELDMVIDVSAMRSGDYNKVRDDIAAVVQAAPGGIIKVILENFYLTKDEIVKGSRLVEEAGAHYVKTSTGFAGGGATLEDIVLMRKSVSPKVKVKAAGGINTLDDALKLIEAGSDRIGISRTRQIVAEFDK